MSDGWVGLAQLGDALIPELSRKKSRKSLGSLRAEEVDVLAFFSRTRNEYWAILCNRAPCLRRYGLDDLLAELLL